MKFKKTLLLQLSLFIVLGAFAQETKKVLFLGNSYTEANVVPMTFYSAQSVGKTLIYDMNTPGGYYLVQHATNPQSLAKIAQGDWDNVVFQDQSLALAYPGYAMNGFAGHAELDSIVKSHNTCAQTLYYVTWGRKAGDTYLCAPPYCNPQVVVNRDYFQMDADIESNYRIFADSLKAGMTPVGAVWRYLRQNHPSIELFDTDGSHPSLAGSFAAACSFYTTIFRSDPTEITFDGWIGDTNAAIIRNAAKLIVYDHLPQWNIGIFDDLLDQSCGLAAPTEMVRTWQVSENPAGQLLQVSIDGDARRTEIIFYNSLGMKVKQVTSDELFFTIDIGGLSSGLYFMTASGIGKPMKLVKK